MATDVDRRIWADLVRPHPTWFGPSRPGSRPLSWAFSSTGARTLCRRERSLLGLSELCRRTSGSIENRFGGKIT